MPDQDERELRLALVMTGGVSLAVWMGGVAGEVYRCIRRQGVYGDLCDLTSTSVTVDVMSGASAGGLNAAFLGSAIAYDLPVEQFDGLRDLWLSLGAFSKLLRDPLKKDPPSLLKGDEFFGPQIKAVLESWIKNREFALNDEGADLTVILTASLLSAELEQYTDDFGTTIREPRHRATFTFKKSHLSEKGSLPAKLALAARTSASFPGAFEASYIPIKEAGTPLADRDRPDMDGIASFDRSHWAVDGGVLVNKPVGPAMEAIADRSSAREIRRVVAYVNPDPGSPQQVQDVHAAAPSLSDVVLKSVITLPRTESIAEHLDELRSINQRANDTRDLRDSLLRGVRVQSESADAADAPPPRRRIPLRNVAVEIYPFWVKQRAVHAVDDRLEAHFVRAKVDASAAIGDGRIAGAATFRELRTALQQERGKRSWLASEFPVVGGAPVGGVIDLAAPDALWRWGFQPLEYIADFALDLVRRSYAILPVDSGAAADLRSRLGELRARAHQHRRMLSVLRRADSDFWAEALQHVVEDFPERTLHCPPDLAAALYDQWPEPPRRVVEKDTNAALTGLPAADREQVRLWREFLALVGSANTPKTFSGDDVGGDAWLTGLDKTVATTTIAMLRSSAIAPGDGALATAVRRLEMVIAIRLAHVIADIGEVVLDVLRLAEGHEVGRVSSAAANLVVEPDRCALSITDPATVLREMAEGLGLLARVADAAEPELRVVDRSTHVELAELLVELLALYVVHSTTDDSTSSTLRIDLIQMSAFGANRLAPERTVPADKVAGLQVGHFGGFLKRSWRANDWMWGAMDGADRIVSMLLEPARLRQRFLSVDEAVAALDTLFTASGHLYDSLDAVDQAEVGRRWSDTRPRAVEELEFLSKPPGTLLPNRLPTLCDFFAEVAQLVIARELLPVVAGAVKVSSREGSDESAEATDFVAAVELHAQPGATPSGAPVTANPRPRLALAHVPALLQRCRIGQERASIELSSDLGAATAAKALAVTGSSVSGANSGLGLLRGPAASLRTAFLGVYFTTATALRKTRIGVALTSLLLAIGAGIVAARLLGADVPSALVVLAFVLLAIWLFYTGLSARAWLPSTLAALVLVLVALSFIDSDKVCTVFANTGCAGDQPGWKSTVPWIVTVVLALFALACVITAVLRRQQQQIDTLQEQIASLGGGVEDQPGPRSLWIAAVSVAALAALTKPVLWPWLFEGDAHSNARSRIIGWIEALSDNRAVVTLLGIPAVFIGLEFARVTLKDFRRRRNHRRALRHVAAAANQQQAETSPPPAGPPEPPLAMSI